MHYKLKEKIFNHSRYWLRKSRNSVICSKNWVHVSIHISHTFVFSKIIISQISNFKSQISKWTVITYLISILGTIVTDNTINLLHAINAHNPQKNLLKHQSTQINQYQSTTAGITSLHWMTPHQTPIPHLQHVHHLLYPNQPYHLPLWEHPHQQRIQNELLLIRQSHLFFTLDK